MLILLFNNGKLLIDKPIITDINVSLPHKLCVDDHKIEHEFLIMNNHIINGLCICIRSNVYLVQFVHVEYK